MYNLKHYDGDPSDHIAIIGMTGRFPGAKNIEEFWHNLRDGVESISFFTREDLAASNIEKSLLTNPKYVGADGVIKDMDMFDAEFFAITPRDAELMDPQHRLFLECAWEVMEQAGYDSESYDGRVAVYGGANLSTYLVRNIMSNPDLREAATSFQTLITNDKDFVATRVSYKMNLRGPSMSVATLCSSSFVAIHLACQSLLNYQCDLALAGAISLQASRNEAFFYQEGGIGDPDGHCRAFDAKASGTVSGSGIGLVVLKRLEDALKDGDTIHAVIRGIALNNDGAVKYSYTAPSAEGQAEVIAEAISLADVNPETIMYVETHGTGTRLGDPIEVSALTKAFRTGTQKKQFCAIGSVKTNIGHLVNAGGVASLIKTILALQHKQIPPSLNFEEPNPEIDFENSPFFVNTELREWRTNGFPRRAGVSSFGIGGTNVHLILEEAPEIEPSGESRAWQLLVLSAATPTALEKQTANLVEHLKRHPDVNLADVAFTLQVGRRALGHRRLLLCRDRKDAISALGSLDSGRVITQFQESRGRPVAFMLPDSGERYVDTGLGLYQSEPTFREQIDRCAEILRPALKSDLRHVIVPSLASGQVSAAGQQFDQPAVARAALFAVEYALATLWMEWGILPQAMLGSGIGEYVAACLAGVLSLEDALALAIADGKGQLKPSSLNPPQIPLVSGATGNWLTDEEATDPTYWTARVGQATRLVEGMRQLLKVPEQVLLEVGPGCVLSTLAMEHPDKASRQVVLPSLRQQQESQPDLVFPLTTLGRLWLSGARVDWNGFHAHERRHRIPLPTYPFERKRYWIEPMGTQAQPAEGRAASETLLTTRKPAVANWFYVPSWKRSLLPVHSPKAPEQLCWLLFVDKCGVGTQLAKRLERESQRVFTVMAGPQLTKLSNSAFALNPDQRIEYIALLNELNAQGARPQKIVHLWSVSEDESEMPLVEKVNTAQNLGFHSLLRLSQALGVRGFTDALQLTVVSNHVQEISSRDVLCPEKATLLGAVKVIPQEYPNVACRSVDIVLPESGDWQERRFIDRLWAELAQDSKDTAVAHRGNQRWVQTFEPVQLDESVKRGSPLREEGVYLVLGGLEGIGLALAEHLARTVRAKLVLTGSLEAAGARPRTLETLGTKALTITVDVADRKQVESAVAQAEERFGQLNGVIYAAGNFGRVSPRSIGETGRTESEQFHAATHGLPVLAQVLAEKELDFCLLNSSLTSVLGGLGLAAHSAASNFIDAFTRQNNRTNATPWLSINWDNWKFGEEYGRDTSFAAHVGELAITPAEGVEAFERALSCGDGAQLIVSTVDLQARIDHWLRLESVRESDKPQKATTLHARPSLLGPYVAPRNEVERTLASIWQELVGIDRIGVHDNFVELGGDSLIGVQVIARANEAGLRLTPQQFFQHQTIAELAAVEGTVSIQAEQGLVTGPVPLTISQHFFLDREQSDPNRWNTTTALEVPPTMNPVFVEQVVQHLLIHHDALRARFVREDSGWRQFIVEPDAVTPFIYVDISSVQDAAQGTTLEQIAGELHRSLDLARGPLLRIAHFNLGLDRPGRLLLIIHHVTLDGVSLPVLLEDFQTAYRQIERGAQIQLPPKTTSFKQWAERLNAYAQSPRQRQELDYWLALPWEQVPPLPMDYPENKVRNTIPSTRSVLVRLSAEETRVLLQSVPQIHKTKIIDALLMALVQALTRWSGERRLVVNVTDFGRSLIPDATDVDLSRTVGVLSTHGCMMLEQEEIGNPGDALRSIQEQLQRIPNRGLGYLLLLYCSGDAKIAEKLRRQLNCDVLFNYIGQQAVYESIDLFRPAFEYLGGASRVPHSPRDFLLYCSAFITEGRLVVSWEYSENIHKRATIKRVAEDFIQTLRSLVVHCQSLSNEQSSSNLEQNSA